MLISCNNIAILEIDGVLENESFPKRSKEQLIVSEHPCMREPLLDCFSLFSEPPNEVGNRLTIIFFLTVEISVVYQRSQSLKFKSKKVN